MKEPQGFYDRLARNIVLGIIVFGVFIIIMVVLTLISPYR